MGALIGAIANRISAKRQQRTQTLERAAEASAAAQEALNAGHPNRIEVLLAEDEWNRVRDLFETANRETAVMSALGWNEKVCNSALETQDWLSRLRNSLWAYRGAVRNGRRERALFDDVEKTWQCADEKAEAFRLAIAQSK